MPLAVEQEFFFQWHLTERCNLRCAHCYQSGRPGEELDLAEVREVLEEISDLEKTWEDSYGLRLSTSFNVTGGEPLLRPDLLPILESIREHRFDVYLLTNGTLIDRETAVELRRTGVKGVQVSVEGPEPVHDAIRGEGSFAGALRGIEALRLAGLPVTLNATLSQLNAAHAGKLVDLAEAVGASRIGFARLVPSGRGASLESRTLEGGVVRRVYEDLFSRRTNGVEVVTGDPVASLLGTWEPAGGDIPVGGCAAGVSGLTFLADGTVTPCRRLPVPIGNVRTDSLRELWATSEVLQALRDRRSYKGRCAHCPRWAECRGCRAIAYAGSGDFLAEDPQCFIDSTP